MTTTMHLRCNYGCGTTIVLTVPNDAQLWGELDNSGCAVVTPIFTNGAISGHYAECPNLNEQTRQFHAVIARRAEKQRSRDEHTRDADFETRLNNPAAEATPHVTVNHTDIHLDSVDANLVEQITNHVLDIIDQRRKDRQHDIAVKVLHDSLTEQSTPDVVYNLPAGTTHADILRGIERAIAFNAHQGV